MPIPGVTKTVPGDSGSLQAAFAPTLQTAPVAATDLTASRRRAKEALFAIRTIGKLETQAEFGGPSGER